MRKQTTFLAVLSTAVFTASMAFPAYAKAAGWTEENGNWYYYDSYGDPLQIHGRNPEMTGIT